MSTSDSLVTLHRNDGNNEDFTAETLSTSHQGLNMVITADIDSDGDIDIAFTSTGSRAIYWLENEGVTGFTRRTISTNISFPVSIFAIDIDGDGDVDIVSGSDYSFGVSLFENDGSESFTRHRYDIFVEDSYYGDYYSGRSYAYSVYAADVNGDGHVDIMATNYNDDAVILRSGFTGTELDVVEGETGISTFSATDNDDNQTLTYSITGGSDAALFNIDSTDGNLVFDTAKEFATPEDADTDNVYEVTIGVTDGFTIEEHSLRVTITSQ